jgi:hypothetical protein
MELEEEAEELGEIVVTSTRMGQRIAQLCGISGSRWFLQAIPEV